MGTDTTTRTMQVPVSASWGPLLLFLLATGFAHGYAPSSASPVAAYRLSPLQRPVVRARSLTYRRTAAGGLDLPASPSTRGNLIPLTTRLRLHATRETRLGVVGGSSSSSDSKKPAFKLPFFDEQSSKSLVSAAAFVVLNVIFSWTFARLEIAFPSSLAGCGSLFALMLLMPKETAESLYKKLQPGADLLARWLPVFFVPSLVTLPLAEGLSGTAELIKAGLVISGGLLFTLLTTSASVIAVRKVFGAGDDDVPSDSASSTVASTTASDDDIDDPVVAMSYRAVKFAEKNKITPGNLGFSNTLFRRLLKITAASAVGAIAATKVASLKPAKAALSTLFLLSSTLTSFVYGSRLPKSLTKVVHPLVTCTGLTWVAATGLGAATGSSLYRVLGLYRTGSMCPPGAGDLLIYLLGPAVVSLAMSMYGRRKLMRDNLAEVGTGVVVSTLGGLFGTALAVRMLEIGSPSLRLSLLSRNITSPLAMAIASILGADVSLAVSIVVVTGLLGANFGASILDAFGIKDPVARGLGMGSAAHGLGTAAFANEKDAFPFAAIAMALAASAATVAVSIPFLRKIILQLALGW